MTIPATLSFVVRDHRVLLLKKAVGLFGQGKWNVPGGKLGSGESPVDCAVRETLEETGLGIRDPEQVGLVHFYKDGHNDRPEWTGYVFVSTEFSGSLSEGREGHLLWFDIDFLPFNEMWEDDRLWYRLVFQRKRFEAWFYYTGDFEQLVDHKIVQL